MPPSRRCRSLLPSQRCDAAPAADRLAALSSSSWLLLAALGCSWLLLSNHHHHSALTLLRLLLLLRAMCPLLPAEIFSLKVLIATARGAAVLRPSDGCSHI